MMCLRNNVLFTSLIGHVFEVSLRELFHLEAAPSLGSSRDDTTHRVVEPCVDTLCQGQTIAQRDEGQPESLDKSRSTTEQPLAVKSAACASSVLGVLKAHLRPKQPLQQRKIENDRFTLLKNLSSLSPHLSWHVLVPRLVSTWASK